MSPLAGPYLAATLVVALAGAVKVADPASSRVALRTVGLPSSTGVARAIGLAEVALAVVVLAVGGPVPAVGVGIAYLGFAVVAELLRRHSGGQADCGCFGSASVPASRLHVAVNLVLALVALATLADPVPDAADAIADSSWNGTALALLVAGSTGLIVLALTRSGKRPVPGGHRVVSTDVGGGAGTGGTPSITAGTGPAGTVTTDTGEAGSGTTDTVTAHPRSTSSGRATDLSGLAPQGQAPVSAAVVDVSHDTVLAFLSSTCITCQRFWDLFAAPAGVSLPAGTRLVLVTKGPDAEKARAVAGLAPSTVPTIMSTEAFTRYGVPGAPYFVRVHGPSGTVRGAGTADDWEGVMALIDPHPEDDGAS